MQLHAAGPSPSSWRAAARSSGACRAVPEGSAPSSSPSRGVLILPGLANNSADYAGLAEHLQSRGLATSVVQVGRADWGRNAAALTDVNWWKGTLKPRPAVDWYLQRVNASLDELKRAVDGGPITLLCHSAGGWLGRVFMLDYGVTGIDRYITLGSPHAPPPPGAEGVVDQTRGILTFCQDACPGAHHPEVKYLTIGGKFIRGATLTGQGSLLQKFAGAGYQQVCGDAEVWGDFIVPLPSTHLDGAINIDLDGCFHSPLGAKALGPWYGSDEMVDAWMHWVSDDWDSLTPGNFEEHPQQAGASSSSSSAAAVVAAGAAAGEQSK